MESKARSCQTTGGELIEEDDECRDDAGKPLQQTLKREYSSLLLAIVNY